MALLFHQLVTATLSEAGARARFQGLVTQLVRLKHPTIKAREIRPAPGDGGIDTFAGDIDGELLVWQSKCVQSIGASQRKQIRESFEAIINTCSTEDSRLAAWTLCIPCSMSLEETRWWQTWKRKAERLHHVAIELWDGSEFEEILNSPDAAAIRVAYLPGPPPTSPLAELAVLPVPDTAALDDMLFVKQLTAAGHDELASSKEQFFNAELMAREISDKAVPGELTALRTCHAEVRGMWEHRFNNACQVTSANSDRLPGLHSSVMGAVEDRHNAVTRAASPPVLRMSMVHRKGTMHQVVELGVAGWTRNYRRIAEAHKQEATSDG